jgi:hypothetical protein
MMQLTEVRRTRWTWRTRPRRTRLKWRQRRQIPPVHDGVSVRRGGVVVGGGQHSYAQGEDEGGDAILE